MYFKDLTNIQKGDLVEIHAGIGVNNFFLESPSFGVYISESANDHNDYYYVKILCNGKIQILNKILITRI